MRVYNTVVRLARSEPPQVPDDCVIRGDALANLADEAPLAQWSRGFLCGHQWLEESWEPYLSGELDQEFGAVLMALTFFASPSLAQAYADECHEELSKLGLRWRSSSGTRLANTPVSAKRFSRSLLRVHPYPEIRL